MVIDNHLWILWWFMGITNDWGGLVVIVGLVAGKISTRNHWFLRQILRATVRYPLNQSNGIPKHPREYLEELRISSDIPDSSSEIITSPFMNHRGLQHGSASARLTGGPCRVAAAAARCPGLSIFVTVLNTERRSDENRFTWYMHQDNLRR